MPSVYDFHHVELNKIGRGKKRYVHFLFCHKRKFSETFIIMKRFNVIENLIAKPIDFRIIISF